MAKGKAESEYQKVLDDLKFSEQRVRQLSKNERYLENELLIRQDYENKSNFFEIENRKLLKMVSKLKETNKVSEENWKIAEENTITRENINMKLQNLLDVKSKQVQKLEAENGKHKETIDQMTNQIEAFKNEIKG